ncbi:serine/threonine-protein kinase [Kitasatospora sp. NPDC004240]
MAEASIAGWALLSTPAAVVAGSALLVRLGTYPLLLNAQAAGRRRAAAAHGVPVPERGPSALGNRLVTGLTVVGVLLLLQAETGSLWDLWFPELRGAIVTSPLSPYSLVYGHHYDWLYGPQLGLALVVLVGWLWLWFLTRRNLLTIGMPAPAWAAARGRIVAGLIAGLVTGLLVLPIGLVLAALVFQAAAFTASRRPAPVVPGTTPPAPVPVPVPASAPQGVPAPRPYTPTQVDRAGAHAPVPAPVPTAPAGSVPHQELRGYEPRVIGGYRLLGRIGTGGMGTVYLARREGSATQVALKTINPELLDDTELLRRFEREAEVLGMVSGAYTARVLDTGVADGRPYLAMELLDGRPLDAHLREQGPIRSPQALRALALALATALAGVHRLGLVHRDLKPGNIMLTTAGPRLLDFGIAAIVDGTRLTRTGGGPGTLTYMAPEQFGDEPVGPAADVWAWACCVVCAAHGASPFAATSTGAVIRRIVDTGPEPASMATVEALDPSLAATVRRALAVEAAERPADGAALLDLLTAPEGPGHTRPDAGALREEITLGWRTLAL